MRHAAQARFETANEQRHIGVEFFQNFCVCVCRVIGAESGFVPRRKGVVAAEALCGGVVVHHGIHAARNRKEKPRLLL